MNEWMNERSTCVCRNPKPWRCALCYLYESMFLNNSCIHSCWQTQVHLSRPSRALNSVRSIFICGMWYVICEFICDMRIYMWFVASWSRAERRFVACTSGLLSQSICEWIAFELQVSFLFIFPPFQLVFRFTYPSPHNYKKFIKFRLAF